tara:strand:- start:47169 stop:48014 length:846 start_codon:yes stop_codon:yes gene_type:complete
MKAYIVGTGSAGCRHSRILNFFGVKTIGVSEKKKNIDDLNYPHSFDLLISLEECNPESKDLVVISSISSKHLELCNRFLSHPLVYCEKPGPNLSSEKIKVLFNLRFLDIIEFFLKEADQIIGIDLTFNTNAKNWHPGEDYRKSYVFNKNLGGGCILTNSHEIDLMHAFGHKFNLEKFTILEKYSDQNDEEIDASFSYQSNGFKIKSSLISDNPKRIFEFKTKTGNYVYDFSVNNMSTKSLNSIDISYYKMWSSVLRNLGRLEYKLLPSSKDMQFIHKIKKA